MKTAETILAVLATCVSVGMLRLIWQIAVDEVADEKVKGWWSHVTFCFSLVILILAAVVFTLVPWMSVLSQKG